MFNFDSISKMLPKSMVWFLYDRDLHHKRAEAYLEAYMWAEGNF